jgi:mannose-6-phosphate isomerase-like protein (cupin superfamily)
MSTSEQPRRGAPTAPWTVVNATEQPWKAAPGWGRFVKFEDPDGERWPQYGFNIHVMAPGDVTTMYHGEGAQEDFVILSGTCLAFVEGEEVPLKAWDVLHCPPWTRHGFANPGDEPCAVLMIGGRHEGGEYDVEYPHDAAAEKHGASVKAYTTDGDVAYAGTPEYVVESYRGGTLPGA